MNLKEKGMETEMKKYKILHQLEVNGNYDPYRNIKYNKELSSNRIMDGDFKILSRLKKCKDIKKKEDIAEFLVNNFDKMDEFEMRNMAMKCLDDYDIRRILLNHELTYYTEEPKKMSLNKFIKKATKIFNRYQCKAGGFLMEDLEWTVYRNDTTKYDVRKNEVMFENTFDISDYDDLEIEIYLKRIVKRLEMISTNIKIELRFITEEKDKIIFVLIWATDMDIVDEPEIGL